MEPSVGNKTNNSNGKLHGLESQLVEGEPVVHFASMAEDLNSGLPRTNPVIGLSGDWSQDLRTTRPAL